MLTVKTYNDIIAFQGIEGANQHLVCKKYFPRAEYKSYQTFEDVFNAVENEKVPLGLVPIENCHAGRVAEIHNLLRNTNLYIVGEYFLDITHHLSGLENATLNDIKTIYSHPQALMQCSNNIKQHNFARESSANTALAAKYVSEKNDVSCAALCSDFAANLHNLKIIKPNFQDVSGNKTIFITIAKEMDYFSSENTKKITTLLFSVRNIPAAIYKSLGGFATNNINIIKLESYISGGNSQEAEFFISFEGNPDQKNVQLALEELGFFSKDIKLLGIYDKAFERNASNY